ncbi:expressed unknown protein [Seminavis robusta]|uniref:Uncharacterized protein n=1 Tax=Seminavis robusta TaxID=568900 RepID=A0A9N8DNQ8_9STRA|nr:expressed unknown protein [Seminavis robusta]|eukprot:Sro231_g093740.1 n/a (166) ;mRNA; f:83381-83878
MNKTEMFCCPAEETVECCSTKAAVTLVGLIKAETTNEPQLSSPGICPLSKRGPSPIEFKPHQRDVWVDCNDVPCGSPPPPKKRKPTSFEEFAALASFLKQEREVLKECKADKISTFYQRNDFDTGMVAEWRNSGNQVYSGMLERIRRLEDMEAKFGSWEEHFGGR